MMRIPNHKKVTPSAIWTRAAKSKSYIWYDNEADHIVMVGYRSDERSFDPRIVEAMSVDSEICFKIFVCADRFHMRHLDAALSIVEVMMIMKTIV